MASDLDRVDHHRALGRLGRRAVAGRGREAAEARRGVPVHHQHRRQQAADDQAVRGVRQPAAPAAGAAERRRRSSRSRRSPRARCTTCARSGSSSPTTSATSPPRAAALTYWHRLEPMCPRCGGADVGDQRRFRPALRGLRDRPLPAYRPGRDRRGGRRQRTGCCSVASRAWGNRVSVLAGFVETGESLEQAIHREIGEEVDISLGDAHLLRQPALAVPALADGRLLRPGRHHRDLCRHRGDRARRLVHPRRPASQAGRRRARPARARARSPTG